MAERATWDGTSIVTTGESVQAPPNYNWRWSQTATRKMGQPPKSYVTKAAKWSDAAPTRLYLYGWGGASLSYVVTNADMHRTATKEAVWAAWQAGRVITPVVNTDEGSFTFRDAVEFHPVEVFDLITLPSGATWTDENTLSFESGQLQIRMADGWTAETAKSGASTVLRPDGTTYRFSGPSVALTRLQREVDGEFTVFEGGEALDRQIYHTPDSPYEGTSEVNFEEVEISAATAADSNFTEGTHRVGLQFTADNIETDDTDESLYQVQHIHPDGTRAVAWRGTAQEEAETAFSDLLTRMRADVSAAEERATAEGERLKAAAEFQEEQQRLIESGEARADERAMEEVKPWEWYLTNPDDPANPFSITITGEWREHPLGDGRVLELTNKFGSLAGAIRIQVKKGWKVRLRLATENWHYVVDNLKNTEWSGSITAKSADILDESGEVDERVQFIGAETGLIAPDTRIGSVAGLDNVDTLDMVDFVMEGPASSLDIDIDGDARGIAKFRVVIDGKTYSVAAPATMDNECYLAIIQLDKGTFDSGQAPEPEPEPEDGGEDTTPPTGGDGFDRDTVIGVAIGLALLVTVALLLRATKEA